jgi:hypothetical protein
MKFCGREAVQIENERVRVTVLKEGGHVAEILEKETGVNPLWIPPWKSIEPSTYDPARHPEYGLNSESKLLAGIMGHNLCLDMFGPPSDEEAEAGLTVHGEGSVVAYELAITGQEIRAKAQLPLAGLRFERIIRLERQTVHFRETLENLTALDRPIAWTQHVTLGPLFIENGVTRLEHSGVRAEVLGSMGGVADRTTFPAEGRSSGFSTHLMNPEAEEAHFEAFNSRLNVGIGYRWRRSDFPWLGIWEENRDRNDPPWSGRTVTWGMEFGASPFPEMRRAMIERRELFGVPAYRWLTAKGQLTVQYRALIFTKQTQN